MYFSYTGYVQLTQSEHNIIKTKLPDPKFRLVKKRDIYKNKWDIWLFRSPADHTVDARRSVVYVDILPGRQDGGLTSSHSPGLWEDSVLSVQDSSHGN